jgi:hypothetical protein
MLRNSVTRTSVSGEKKDKSDHADNASIRQKSGFAWNEMAGMNRSFIRWFREHLNDYAPCMDEYRNTEKDMIAYGNFLF